MNNYITNITNTNKFINNNIQLSYCINDFFTNNLYNFTNNLNYQKFQNLIQELSIKKIQHKFIEIPKLKKIKKKKAYELFILGELVNDLSNKYNIKNVLDIGCGVGHLINYLQLTYRINCIGLELNKNFINSKKYENLNIINYKLTKNTDFNEIINKFKIPKSIVIANHCCGEFSSNILKQFIKTNNFKILILVGCCYFKIKSFPLSETLKSLKTNVNMDSLALANHWSNINHFRSKRILFRCSLQVVFKNYYPQYNNYYNSKIKWKKIYENYNFYEYVSYIINILNEQIIDEDSINKIYIESHKKLNKLREFWKLRNKFGEIIESLIILDRVMFLLENNIKSEIIEIYDSKISNKSLAIISIKS